MGDKNCTVGTKHCTTTSLIMPIRIINHLSGAIFVLMCVAHRAHSKSAWFTSLARIHILKLLHFEFVASSYWPVRPDRKNLMHIIQKNHSQRHQTRRRKKRSPTHHNHQHPHLGGEDTQHSFLAGDGSSNFLSLSAH